MKAATKPEAKTYFGIFRFGAKERTFEGEFPLWEYFVRITARSDQEARELMRANFGAFERVYTEEQFTDAVSGFYPRGCYCELSYQKDEYFVLSPASVNAGWTLPDDWKKMILFRGTAQECCDKINKNTTADLSSPKDMSLCIITDGEKILIEWLRMVDHYNSRWVPQKFI